MSLLSRLSGTCRFYQRELQKPQCHPLAGCSWVHCHGLISEDRCRGEGLLPVPHHHAQEISLPLRDMDSPRAETATALAPSKKHEPPASRSFLTWGASRHCPPKPRGGSGFPLLLTFGQAAVLCLVSLPFHPLDSQLSSLCLTYQTCFFSPD